MGVSLWQGQTLPHCVTPGGHEPLQDSASQDPQPEGHPGINRHMAELQVRMRQEQETTLAGLTLETAVTTRPPLLAGPNSQLSALRGTPLSPSFANQGA